ncbi:MAG: amidohydrolase family protein [Acidimicrobiales bacterium]
MAAWEGPGFVDAHAHLLAAAAGTRPPYGDHRATDAVGAWHRRVSERWSTPADELDRPLAVDDALRGALEGALERAAAVGLVEVTEAGMTDWAHLEALLALRARGPLAVRVRLLVASGAAALDHMSRTGDPWLEVVGVKFYADGWLGSRTAALAAPYADVPDDGILFLDADTLARRADPFAEAGWLVATHAVGDRAIEATLDGYERLFGRDCAAAAPRVEHAQVLRTDLVQRMADLGVVACVQPGFGVADAEMARRALGGRWEDAYRWDRLLDAGVEVIAGSDFPVEDLSPLAGLQRLVTGDDLDGRRAGAPTLPLDAALAVMTDAGAGTTVLADDPHRVDEDRLATVEVVDVRPAG